MYLCQPGTQRHARILMTGGVTQLISSLKLTSGDGCHSCELQSTLNLTLRCFMYPQGRCVPVPTRDPTSRADFDDWGCDPTNKFFQADQWRWVPFL